MQPARPTAIRRLIISVIWMAVAYYASRFILGFSAGLCFFGLAAASITVPDRAGPWINYAFSTITIGTALLALVWGIRGKLPGTGHVGIPFAKPAAHSAEPLVTLYPSDSINHQPFRLSDWIMGGLSAFVIFVLGAILISLSLRGRFAITILPISLALGIANGYLSMCKRRNRRARLARKEGYCRVCGYDLMGNVSGICPECGTFLK